MPVSVSACLLVINWSLIVRLIGSKRACAPSVFLQHASVKRTPDRDRPQARGYEVDQQWVQQSAVFAALPG